MEQAKCYLCLGVSIADAIKIALLVQTAVNGTGLYSGDYGGIAPVFVPSSTTAIAFDTTTGTQWNWFEGAWH